MFKSQGWAAWFTGLPGSGKSTVVERTHYQLEKEGVKAVILSMDNRRKVYSPDPEYTDEERDQAYAMFADEAAEMVMLGDGVLMDATASQLKYRARARMFIVRFMEVHVHCPLELTMQREAARPDGQVMAALYAKALDRSRTGKQFSGLGRVVGVDIPFEVDDHAECVLDTSRLDPDQAAREAVRAIVTMFG